MASTTITQISTPERETVSGLEVCIFCASLINAGLADDGYGGQWAIDPAPPMFDVAHCDLCRNPIGADRVSASVTI